MSENLAHWAEVSKAYKKDLDLVVGVIVGGEDNAHASVPVREALARLETLIEALSLLDQTDEKNVAALEAILFYIGYRAGRVMQQTGIRVRPSDIKIPASHVLALIQGGRTLDQLIAEVDVDLGVTPEPS